MNAKQPAVYVLASAERGTLYVGVTGWLKHRIWEHREGKEHNVKRLVWFELCADFSAAITREKQLKKWNRGWKIELIEATNPAWRDLWPDLVD